MGKLIEFGGLVGASLPFRSVIQALEKIAAHDISFLLEGEKGTGKEALAQAVHFKSKRSSGEFIIVDCASAPEPLLEAELFGYLRGSFAGALQEKKGLLELANGGTLYLDHISKASVTLQWKLIRFLETHSFYRLGGVSQIESNVRVIAATDEDLAALVSKGKFRSDLFYQLSAVRITIPPLRERVEDILALAEHFLSELNRGQAVKKEFTDEARHILLAYHWPGNVRQLQCEINRSVIFADDAKKISPKHLSVRLVRDAKENRLYEKNKLLVPGSLKARKSVVVAELEKEAIQSALKEANGNRTKTAKLLGISRQDLLRKLTNYKIR